MAKKKAQTPAAPKRPKMAFQCDNCKAVFPAGLAGDNDVPLACPHCRAGVHFQPDGTRVYKPENWIRLADLSATQLAKGHHVHGLKPEHVAKHGGHDSVVTPQGIVHGRTRSFVSGKDHARAAEEGLGAKDHP